jgi:hypothetical protein
VDLAYGITRPHSREDELGDLIRKKWYFRNPETAIAKLETLPAHVVGERYPGLLRDLDSLGSLMQVKTAKDYVLLVHRVGRTLEQTGPHRVTGFYFTRSSGGDWGDYIVVVPTSRWPGDSLLVDLVCPYVKGPGSQAEDVDVFGVLGQLVTVESPIDVYEAGQDENVLWAVATMADGRTIDERLIEQGLGAYYPHLCQPEWQLHNKLTRLETAARRSGKGFWGSQPDRMRAIARERAERLEAWAN